MPLAQDWLKTYFSPTDSPASRSTKKRSVSALAALSASPICRTDRLPVYLQHDGHSRTIVGLEVCRDGDWLLLFDPGKVVDAKVRRAGLVGAAGERAKRLRSASPPLGEEEEPEDEKAGAKRKGFGLSKFKKLAAGGELDPARWADTLKPFRVSAKQLAKHDEYQVSGVSSSA